MKVLTDKEILKIVEQAIIGDGIDCADQYRYFLEDLGRLVADHFGGYCAIVGEPLCDEGGPDETSWCLHFVYNECVPKDGGVYAQFDTDITIEEWKGEKDGKHQTR